MTKKGAGIIAKPLKRNAMFFSLAMLLLNLA
jgi:hypothetical protein